MVVFVALTLLGIALLLAEVVIPGGVVGALGALCLVAAAITAYIVFDREVAHWVIVAFALAAIGGVLAWARYFPHSRLARGLVAQGVAGEPNLAYRRYLDATGVAETPLRPAGVVRIDGRRLDVISDGEFIDSGSQVRVVEARGNRLIVRATSVPGS